MSMTLEINGQPYQGFTDASVARSMETVASTFSFQATAQRGAVYPINAGDKARVLIGEKSIVNGFVENVTVSYSATDHVISIDGRDRTCDIVDSSLGGRNNYIAPIGLVEIIQRVLDGIQASDIQIKTETGALQKFQKGELVAGAVDKNAFEFIEEYCRKRQVLCTTDGEGNILLTKASNITLPAVLVSKEGEGNNSNILSATSNSNDSERFNRYIFRSQGNPSVEGGVGNDARAIVSRRGEATDPDIRASRQMVQIAESSSGKQTAQERAEWQANFNKARSFSYNVSVQGFTLTPDSEEIWQPNRLVYVEDDFANINDTLLIRDCNYRYGLSQGSVVDMTLVDPLSYTLDQQRQGLERGT